MFFFLDEKEPKNQGCTKFAKIQLQYAKNDKLAYKLKQYHFLNANLVMPKEKRDCRTPFE